ncbi:hypothetical protein BKA67DRAFT_552087 [Truncatella angustata]|uniref:Uncharacterized protein n=1 Tax=Truncatella angustata TaxID=152316 RepID=A0A9P8UQF8_9PEZI|nr:uncharacterized protein BKA67DRAFT_552087 [Truncatella angustata]KAH6656473.1 hypothetical protein BKA67DRAFT_552087 [Truncatella angustata]KAH8203241.1 hypothetical protein TruAng_002539 [Truncatella angustata]
MSQLKSRLNGSTSKARDPPPSLFLHPSPAASNVSLPGLSAVQTASSMGPSSTGQHLVPSTSNQAAGPPKLTRQGSLLNPRGRGNNAGPIPRLQTGDSSRTVDRTDALWAEMQATLEEVELSASGGTHVFGLEHDRKLTELRSAQIALAQAWARSEADDAIDTTDGVGNEEVRDLKGALGGAGLTAAGGAGPGLAGKASADGTDPGKSTVGTGTARPPSSGRGGEKLGAMLEQETESDILLARKRREANDRYFSRVDQGVRDVVAKLEDVAITMRAVEQESRDVWGEESVPGSAKP